MGVADDLEGQARVTGLKQGLQELGWTDGRNIQIETLSFPKIISGRNGGASRTRLGWRQWRRTAGLPDPAACLCPRPSAYGPDCNTPHKKKEFAAGAIRQRSASGPSTRDARCQSDAPRTDFAKAIQARSVGRGCPSPSRVT